jgi:hypothetical protein
MSSAAFVADFNRFHRFLFEFDLGVKQLVAAFRAGIVFERLFCQRLAFGGLSQLVDGVDFSF